jgi:NAD(P)-dependent dehydrogenase (short-subunit alcohol dehydrogenase family)
MNIANATVFVTGANRGIGRQLIELLLKRNPAKIYAAARNADSLKDLVALAPDKVVPIQLDITNQAQVTAAAAAASDTTILINNAGVLSTGTFLEADLDLARRDMETNYFGTLNMARAFAPVLKSNAPAALTNVLSVVSLANMNIIAAYSASKAAAYSLTQALRAELAPAGISVHGVYPGPVETDMTDGFEMDKADPTAVANEILDGIEANREDIFPDAMAASVADAWLSEPKSLERQFSPIN